MNNAKPAIVLITFVLFIALFANGAMEGTDLTPDTPPASPNTSFMDTSNFAAPAGDPLYSPCGSSYTVRSGDTLSRIAVACNVSLADLIAANPLIGDPNYISPGQQLAIVNFTPVAAAPQPAAAAPAVAAPAVADPAPEDPFAAAAAASTDAAASAAPDPAPADASPAVLQMVQEEDVSIPTTGLRPGSSIHVTIQHLPGSTPAEIAIGRVGDPPLKLEERATDENGMITLTVAIPPTAQPGEQWVVVVTTTTVPPLTVSSAPFTIE